MLSKKLTNSCWLLTSSLGTHTALVWQRGDAFISSHRTDRTYANLEEIAREFAEPLTEKSEIKEEIISRVLEYPTRHTTAFDISAEPFPTYKSKENSSVTFAAGYWVIHFNGAYRITLSPKVSTLDDLCVGPFLDKFSANVSLNTCNKQKETDKIISTYGEQDVQES
jgi:hypothetical protein